MSAIEELVTEARKVVPRFFPVVINQDVTQFPAATYQVVSRVPHASLSGPSDMDFLQVDITIFADSPGEALELSETLRSALETFNFDKIKSCRYRESGGIEYHDFLQKYAVQYEYRISINLI